VRGFELCAIDKSILETHSSEGKLTVEGYGGLMTAPMQRGVVWWAAVLVVSAAASGIEARIACWCRDCRHLQRGCMECSMVRW
jgi:hypothetical protein